jgi:deoxyribodipyrimidine photolyase-related protein
MRNLVVVLGDQLNHDSAAFDGFDRTRDAVWMAEVQEEATHVWCHKLRIAFFFSAMRHFRDELSEKRFPVEYHELTQRESEDRGKDFATVLRTSVRQLRPRRIIVVMPGDYRVVRNIQEETDSLRIELQVRPDNHFYCGTAEFAKFAAGKKRLLLELFYRYMRKRHSVLLADSAEPVGGKWNFDKENRQTFGRQGPEKVPVPLVFPPDRTTVGVMEMVGGRFRDHPGNLDSLGVPVTHDEAQDMLQDFIEKRLPNFGTFEDAMWTDEPFLYHSRLSTSLNLKLLNPRDCVEAAVRAYQEGDARINNVEGFVRQVLGWREYIRGIYWLHMPGYIDMNYFGHELDVPAFFWNGDTDMECIRQTMQHILKYGYSHHIQRLMVMGLFALLLGVHPRRFHEWHMAMYLDAIDWASLPNALGMSQYGDGGIVGTKPYVASGSYINRMSDFCRHCPYAPSESVGEEACPFTTLYWDFLDRHYDKLKGNPRLGLQMRNVEKMRAGLHDVGEIRKRANRLRRRWEVQGGGREKLVRRRSDRRSVSRVVAH